MCGHVDSSYSEEVCRLRILHLDVWVGKRVHMSVEVCMDCACRVLGICGLKRGCI